MKKHATARAVAPPAEDETARLRHELAVLRSFAQAVVATGAADCLACRSNADAARWALEQLRGAQRKEG